MMKEDVLFVNGSFMNIKNTKTKTIQIIVNYFSNNKMGNPQKLRRREGERMRQ